MNIKSNAVYYTMANRFLLLFIIIPVLLISNIQFLWYVVDYIITGQEATGRPILITKVIDKIKQYDQS